MLNLIAKHVGCSPADIVSYDLSLFDTQEAVAAPTASSIYASRLDNQASCYAALEALCQHTSSASFVCDELVSMVALFDHEEVGSGSAVGAGSVLMAEALERVHSSLCDTQDTAELLNIAKRR